MSKHSITELNPEQRAVVEQGNGPCLVLAGAGSGKTKTLVERVAYLLKEGVLPQEILLLTFTNKAAREMLHRVESVLGRTPQGLWGGTFHHVAHRVLRRYAKVIGMTSNFTILDEEDSRDLLKLCVKDVRVDTTAHRFPKPRVLKSIISYSRNSQREIDEVVEERHPKFARDAEVIKEIAVAYESRKRKANAMDFDDLLMNLLSVLEHPDAQQGLAMQFRYVLVDEYQDTNRIQAAIVARFASAHGNVLVVGDDAQSIYSFRAADVGNILRFPEAFPGARTFRIETNYRSTPSILKVANSIIEHNEQQFQKTLRPSRRGGGKPRLVETRSLEDEARAIAQRVLEARDDGVPLGEIAVLFRATHISQFLEMELVKRDIPYDYRGGIRFFERAHIKDVLAFLKIVSNPSDEAAWLRVLRMQPGIGDVGALRIIEMIRDGGGSDPESWTSAVMTLPPRLASGWSGFQDIVRAVLGTAMPGAMIRALTKGAYRDYLEASYPNWQERLDDLEQLARFSDQHTELDSFLAETSLQELFGAERVGRDESDDERMVLSTIHQSKGLEWHTVFVMGMTAATFPNRRALLEDNGIEEERRLFYVATTRAKQDLTFSYALAGGGESAFLRAPSPFLFEIPEELLERIGVTRLSPTPFWNDDRHEDGEPVIVLNRLGERAAPSIKRASFLRDVDEL
jgi:DNA helicase II / ATP-dependent DNA helicase PcrA